MSVELDRTAVHETATDVDAAALPVPLQAPACPLCGGANGCAVARTGRFDAPCWCTEASFGADLLASLPAAAAGRACICADCAAAPRIESSGGSG